MKKIFFTVLNALAFSALYSAEKVRLDSFSVVGSMEKGGGEIDTISPRNLTSISQERIREEGVRQLDEAVRYESGFIAQPYGSNLTTNYLNIRGFNPTIMLDGTALYNKGSYWGWTPDMYGLERIEILKGADSLMYGSSQSGGLVNLVSKRPTKKAQGEAGITGGTQKERGAFFDMSDSIITDSVKMRLVGNYQKRDGNIKGSWLEHYYVAPSLSIQITPFTLLTLLGSYQYDNGIPPSNFYPVYGTILNTPYGKINKANLGSPESDFIKKKQMSLGYEITHQFHPNFTFTQNYRYNKEDRKEFLVYFSALQDSGRLANRNSIMADGIATAHTLDNRIVYQLNTNFLENRIIAGIDYQNIRVKGVYGVGYNIDPIDIFNPVHTPQKQEAIPKHFVHQSQIGAYLQEKATLFQNLILQGGIRYDKAKSDSQNIGTYATYNVGYTTFQAGALYVFEYIGLMPFINYSESFLPISGSDGESKGYKPYEGRQYETGIKYLPYFMDAEINISYFDLIEKNGFVKTKAFPIQTGKQTSKGIDAYAHILLSDSLQWLIAYTHTKATMTLTNAQIINSPVIPREAFASKITYTIKLPHQQTLKAGIGIRHVGKTTDEAGNPQISIPSYSLYDALLHYRFKEWYAQMNITNFTNKQYSELLL